MVRIKNNHQKDRRNCNGHNQRGPGDGAIEGDEVGPTGIMEALMESKYEVVAAVDARVQSDNSGHKRPRDEKGFQRIGESSDNKLVGHRHELFNISQYLFSPLEISQQWENGLPQKLKDCSLPSSSKACHPSLLELVDSYQIMVEEYGLLSWALRKCCNGSEAKQAQSDMALAFRDQQLAQLRQTLETISYQNQEFMESISSLETKITNYIPKLRSNHILYAQATLRPFDVSQVNFGCMRQLTNVDVVFNVVNPSNTEWELFQKKWKEFDNLFFPPEPKATTLATIEEANNEGRKM
ncbi:hypothetical protein GOBAR_AA26356 [Gossypium barbadense]|uniref:Uncharacterized protein n=1 Tax=Gossypium barbadense TaxID=3634 RepID=A0A2P5WTB0_GOSBA|nr:hypothetical protein GOBAR_AA26356 [Gossypium barbadense]